MPRPVHVRIGLPLGITLSLLLLAPTGCDRLFGDEPAPARSGPGAHEDLLIGYELLADTLADESHLHLLKIFKKITRRGPVDEVGELMDTLGKTSKQRAKELKQLRKLAPDVSGKPATHSPIGDAITAVAKEAGKDEMLEREGAFNLRFVMLQAQATRMVAAIATAIAEYEPNAERKRWLQGLAREYEGHRDGMIEVVHKYVEGKGSAQ